MNKLKIWWKMYVNSESAANKDSLTYYIQSEIDVDGRERQPMGELA